jgi:hypothetical protein
VVIRERVSAKMLGLGANGFEGKLRVRKTRIEQKRTFRALEATGGRGRGFGRDDNWTRI